MNKRNYFIYPTLLLGALFSTYLSRAVTLGEGLPTDAAIKLATKFKANHSMAYGYSDYRDEYSSHRFYPVYFITDKYVIALVDTPESIQEIEYKLREEPITRKVTSVHTLKKVGPYQVVLYELEESIKDVKPIKLAPSTEELLKETVYVFSYGKDRKIQAAYTKKAETDQEFIKVPFQTEDIEESESPEPNGFLIGHEDFGCSLISRDGDSFILLGLGISNDEHQSFFVSLTNEMVEKIRGLVPELKPKDTSSTRIDLAKEPEEQEEAADTSASSIPVNIDSSALTASSSTPLPQENTEELNLFDHPIEWREGDKVEIRPDGTWVVTHQDGRQEQRIGLIFPDMQQGESISFEITKVFPVGKESVTFRSDQGIKYGVYPYGIATKFFSEKDQIDVYANGWTLITKDGIKTWKYKEPLSSSLNKERSCTMPNGTVVTIYPAGQIKWEGREKVTTKYPDSITTQYQSGVTHITSNDGLEYKMLLPNGMVFEKSKDSEWKLTSSITEHKKPHAAIHCKLPDATLILISAIDGRAEWTFKDGSVKTYSLDGKETFVPTGSSAEPSSPNQSVAQVPATATTVTNPARSNGAAPTATPGSSSGHTLSTTPATPARGQQTPRVTSRARKGAAASSTSNNASGAPQPSPSTSSASDPEALKAIIREIARKKGSLWQLGPNSCTNTSNITNLQHSEPTPVTTSSFRSSTQSSSTEVEPTPSASSQVGASVAPRQSGISNFSVSSDLPTPPISRKQTDGVFLYEAVKRQLLAVPSEDTPAIRRILNELLDLTILRHEVTHEIDKEGHTEFTERVTYASGLCLVKKRGQSNYTCNKCPSTFTRSGHLSYKYPSGTKEYCFEHRITVSYPTAWRVHPINGTLMPFKEKLRINCDTGSVEFTCLNSRVSQEGNLFGDQPTVTLDWSEETGLTATFMTPPVSSADTTSVEQASTATSTQNSTSSTTTTTSTRSSSPNRSSTIQGTKSSTEGSLGTKETKRKRVEESSLQEPTQPRKKSFSVDEISETRSIINNPSSKAQKTNEKGVPIVMRPYVMEKGTSSKKRAISEKDNSTKKGSSSKSKTTKKSSGTKKQKTRKGDVSASSSSSQGATPRRSIRICSRKEQQCPSKSSLPTDENRKEEKGCDKDQNIEEASLLTILSQGSKDEPKKSRSNKGKKKKLVTDESSKGKGD